jgi:quercetin dioxygenase-like cupin family protein
MKGFVIVFSMYALLAVGASCGGMTPANEQPGAEGEPPAAAAADAQRTPVVMLAPDELEWRPADVLPPGASMALMEGNPAEEGYFALRLRFPANYRIPPHYHPAVERVTVLEGTFHLGHGERWDDDAMEEHVRGSYISMPAGMRHFARAGDQQVIVQLASLGPWGITYVDPADDPRREPAAVR